MISRKNRVAVLAFLVGFLCISVTEAQKIPLATGEWVPYTSASMEDYGLFTKRVNIVLEAMDVEAEYHFYPWGRCFDSVVKARVWAAFPFSYTRDRAEKVWYSDALSCSKTVFFYYHGKGPSQPYHFNSLEDIKAYRVGGVTGYFYESLFKNAGLRIDYGNSEIAAMEKLKMGRIDLMPVNHLVGWNLINTKFPKEAHNFATLAKPLSSNTLRLIVSKDFPGSSKLLERFNLALQKCIQNGMIEIEQCEKSN